MKKTVITLLCLVLLIALLPLAAAPARADTEGDWEYTIADGKAAITKYTGSGGDVTIPAALGGKPVTEIGGSAFKGCTGLTGVTIPDGVTSIGYDAFNGCSGLTGLTIPDSVTYIGWSAFNGCSGLTGLTIPDGVAAIDSSTFYNCTGLRSVTIGSGVTKIGGYAFYNCSALTDLTLGSGVTLIDGCAFSGCRSLTSVTIPDSVATISDSAFKGCSGLTSVTFGSGVTAIGWSAFYGCSSLTSLTIPDGVTSIGDGAFRRCTSLTSLTIPDGVTEIGNSAFDGCSSLTSLTIPDSVTAIGSYTFCNCSGLTRLTVGSRVASIGEQAFFGCSRLKDVYYGSTAEDWKTIIVARGNEPLTSAAIHYTEPLALASVTPDKTTVPVGTPVTWTAAASGGSGTLKYRFYIYRDGSPVQKGEYGKQNTVTYTPTEPGTYTVRAYAKDDNGSLSLTGGAVTVTPPPPAVPAGLKVTSSLEGITVSWNAVSGAAKYRVIRTVDGVTTKIKVSGTSWTDTGAAADKNYTYSVQAQSAEGIYSEASETKSLYYPLGIAVKVKGTKANVSWTPVTGATKYQMYRRSYKDGKYGAWVLIYSAKGTSFVDAPGKGTWQYRVRAVVDGTKTAYSNRKKITVS